MPKTVKAGKAVKEVAPPAKVKKDKAAPKQARSAYTFYLEEVICPSQLKLFIIQCYLLRLSANEGFYSFDLFFNTRHMLRSNKMTLMPHSVKSPRRSLPNGRIWAIARRPSTWLCLTKTRRDMPQRRMPMFPPWASALMAKPWLARVARPSAPRRTRTYPRAHFLPTSSSARRCAASSRPRHQVRFKPVFAFLFSYFCFLLLTFLLSFSTITRYR